MKLKTALELLGLSESTMAAWMSSSVQSPAAISSTLELVARRAREEAYEMAAFVVCTGCTACTHASCTAERIAAGKIRALPTEPTP